MPEHTPAPTPSRAVYGFALLLTFKSFFIIYLLWAFVPEKWFHSIGITYLPQRYWAIAIPIFSLTIFAIFALVIYPSLGLCLAQNPNDIETITDPVARYVDIPNNLPHQNKDEECVCRNRKVCSKKHFDSIDKNEFIRKSIPHVRDIQMTQVSETLYL